MADRFTEEEIEVFKNAFQLLDREGNGLVHFKQLGFLLRSVGENPSDQKLSEIINELLEISDSRGPSLDFTDFLLIMSKLRHADEASDIQYVFNVFDKEGTGVMRTKELRAALESVPEDVPAEDIDEMLSDFDLNGNGEIEFEEFAAVMGFNMKLPDTAEAAEEGAK
ncbi:calmodulin-like [Diadema antillarum]|uniref:calmodulin-like n=1 Tax=Diadema antillarum TaxID=105358 RepID=UPI003A8811C3